MLNSISLYRVSNLLFRLKLAPFSWVIDRVNFLLFNCYIPGKAVIGSGSRCAYGGIGVVIHANARIGRNCTIGQNVTIGANFGDGIPTIGDDVFIGPGARILGKVSIGNNCIIGANAVVLSSVDSNSVVAGIPARLIKVRPESRL